MLVHLPLDIHPALLLVAALGFGWILPAIMGISSLFGGMGRSSQQNRQDQNQFTQNQNQLGLQQYGIQQGAASNALNATNTQLGQQQQALLNLLGLQETGTMNRALLDLNQRRFNQDQREFALNAPSTRGRQAIVGSLLQNIQPVQMSNLNPRIARSMPTITGGLTPAALGADARQMGRLLSSNAIQGQMRGDPLDSMSIPSMPDTSRSLIDPSRYPDPQSSLLTPPTGQGYRGPSSMESILGLLGAINPVLGAWSAGGGSLPGQRNDFMQFSNYLPAPPGARG